MSDKKSTKNKVSDITNNLLDLIKNETSKKVMQEEHLKDRFRCFSLVLYDDTDSYNFDEVIRNIKTYKNYAYIKHDKDLKEDNTLKKIHYHCILKLDNACTISALSKKLDIPDNYIQNVRNERTMVRYLIHVDDPLKVQYDKNDIIASPIYSRYVGKCFEGIESEEEQLSKIYTFVSDLSTKAKNQHDALYLLVQYVNSNCYDTIYKRYRFEINDYLRSLF